MWVNHDSMTESPDAMGWRVVELRKIQSQYNRERVKLNYNKNGQDQEDFK